MIALVSSTIFPPAATAETLYRQALSPRIRFNETVETIRGLDALGAFKDIFIFDNSGLQWQEVDEDLLNPAKLIKFNSFQFSNKSISEIYMLLAGLALLPDDTPIFKISGRYQVSEVIASELLSEHDFAGKICFDSKTISTRGYYVKNKQVLEQLLIGSINYIYSYSHKVVGPRSLIKVIKNAFGHGTENFHDPTISVEQGMFAALKGRSVKALEKIHIKGIMAGPFEAKDKIDE